MLTALLLSTQFHTCCFLTATFGIVLLALFASLPASFLPLLAYGPYYLFTLTQSRNLGLEYIYGHFFLTFLFFLVLYLLLHLLRRSAQLETQALETQCEASEQQEIDLRQKNKNQIIENMQIERDYDNTIKLYETIRNMSGTLESGNIIDIYVNTMIELVPLIKGTIVLFGENEAPGSSDRYFTFHSTLHYSRAAQLIEDKRHNPFEDFVSQYKKEPREFYFEPEDRDKYSPYGIRSLDHPLTILPIKSDKIIIGAVIVEGSQKRYLEQLKTITTFLGIEIKKANLYEKVKRLSVNDGLTGLFLRRYFTQRIEESFSAGGSETNAPLSLLVIDIDKFKHINDQFGHSAGDLILKEVARLLEQNARGIDLVSRFGGDEFSIGLPNTSKQEALQIAERLRVAVEAHRISFEGAFLQTTVSIGVATHPEDGKDFQTLFSHADLALYAAKNTGSNRVLSFRKAFLK